MGDFQITDKMVTAYMAAHGCSEEKAREELSKLSPQEQADLASLGGKMEAYGDYFNPRITKFKAEINGEKFNFVEGENDNTERYVAKNAFGGVVEFFKTGIPGMFGVGSKEGSLVAVTETTESERAVEAAAKRQQQVNDAKLEYARNIYRNAFADTNTATEVMQQYLANMADENNADLTHVSKEQIENVVLTLKNVLDKLPKDDVSEMIKIVGKFNAAKAEGNQVAMDNAKMEMEAFIKDAKREQYFKQCLEDAVKIGAGVATAAALSTPAGWAGLGVIAVFASCGPMAEAKQSTVVNVEQNSNLAAFDKAIELLASKIDNVTVTIQNEHEKDRVHISTILSNYKKDLNDISSKLSSLISIGELTVENQEKINEQLARLEKILLAIQENGDVLIKSQDGTNMSLDQLIFNLQLMHNQDSEEWKASFKTIVSLLNNISSIALSINGKLASLLSEVPGIKEDLAAIKKNQETQIGNQEELIKAQQRTNNLLVAVQNTVACLPTQLAKQIKPYLGRIIHELAVNNTYNAAFYAKLDKIEAFLDEISATVKKMENNQTKQMAQIANLMELVEKFGYAITEGMGDIIDQVKEGNLSLKNLEALMIDMKAIEESQNVKIDEGNKKLQELLKKQDITIDELKTANEISNLTLKTVNILGVNVMGKLQEILEKIKEGNIELGNMAVLLNAINTNIVKYGEAGTQIGNTIIELISKYGDKGVEIGNTVIELLDKFKGDTSATMLQILEELKSGKVDLTLTNALLTDLNKKADTNNSLNKEILENLKSGMENVTKLGEEGNQLKKEILEAIKNLNLDTSGLVALIDATNANGAKLDEIIQLLKTINTNVVNNGKVTKEMGEKILEALKKMGNDIAGSINIIIGKMDAQPNYTTILNKILAKLGDVDANNNSNFAALLEAIAKHKGTDLTKLLAKLDEILAAIKDHEVHVDVDVSGNVTCHCDGNCPNEGIIEELHDIFG